MAKKNTKGSANASAPRSSRRKVVLEVGFALAAAAASAYLLSGKRGAKNRKKLKGWAVQAERKVAAELKKAKKFDQKAYNAIVDRVTAEYKAAKKLDRADVRRVVGELKGHWRHIKKHVAKVAARAKR